MKRLVLNLAALLLVMTAKAQSAENFKPYQPTDLRLPAVPLVVNDPYFSIWSPYDKLTDGSTRHWTDDQMPLLGLLRVDGKVYRFMGKEKPYVLEPVAGTVDIEPWRGKITRHAPGNGWEKSDFDDAAWREAPAAFGTQGEYPHVRTRWNEQNSDIYVRRTIEVSAEDAAADLYLIFSHDDVFELYINGTNVVKTGETWKTGEVAHLDGNLKGLLKPGKNVIAAHCHNTTGGAYLDFGIYKNVMKKAADIEVAKQKDVNVLATNTYYTFECGPVDLTVVFTAPMLIDDLDLLSTPINYI